MAASTPTSNTVYGKINVRVSRTGIKREPKKLVHAYVGVKHAGVANLINRKTGQSVLVNSARYPSVRRYQQKELRKTLDELNRVLTEAYRSHGLHMAESGAAVMYNALLPTLNKSEVYCPKSVDGSHGMAAGALAATGELVVVERVSGKTRGVSTVEISYGRTGRVWYAAFVHEIRKYKHVSPTRYKFLESAVKEDLGKIPERIAAELRKAAGDAAKG